MSEEETQYDPESAEYDPRRRRRARRYDPPRRRRRGITRGIRLGRGATWLGVLAGMGAGVISDTLVKNLGVDLKGFETFVGPVAAVGVGTVAGGWVGGLGALLGHVIVKGLPAFWGKEAKTTEAI